MEEKRTAIAILLCLIVVMVYTEVVIAPQTRQAQYQQQLQQTQALRVAPSGVPTNLTSSAASPSIASAPASMIQAQPREEIRRNPTAAELKAANTTTIDSDKFSATLTHLGARLASFKLKDYKLAMGSMEPLDMVHAQENAPLPLGVQLGELHDGMVNYTLEGNTSTSPHTVLPLPENADLALTFRGTLPDGRSIRKTVRFTPHSYQFNVEVELSAPDAARSKIWLEWTHFVPNAAVAHTLNQEQFTLLTPDNKLNHFLPTQVTEGIVDSGQVMWSSFNDKYFAATLAGTGANTSARIGRNTDLFRQQIAGGDVNASFSLYVGPKDYRILKDLPGKLYRVIDLGIFSFLAYPLLWGIRFFYHLLGNYGLAIILFTLAIKALFLPLTKVSMRSMQAMQDLQPEMKELRERVKDSTQLNQEMMALYKRRGVNPMGGCLPMLIQIPVFLGLYNALLYAIEMRHAPFALWITDLSATEALNLFGVPIPVMVILMGLSMFFQQYLTPSAADPAQRKVMLLMPVVFTIMFIVYPFPAGLVLYWLVNNLISIVQQMTLRSKHPMSPALVTAYASGAIFLFGWVVTLL